MSPNDASNGKPYTLVGPPVHENRWDEDTQAVVGGYVQRVRWLSNQAIIPVFIPDGADFAATLDARARHQGEQFDAALGG